MPRGSNKIRSQVNDDSGTLLIDMPHFCDLLSTLLRVLLVDTKNVEPNHPDSSRWSCETEHLPAVVGLEDHIPVWTNEYRMAELEIVIVAAPGIRDGLILRATGLAVCLQGHMNGVILVFHGRGDRPVGTDRNPASYRIPVNELGR